MSSLPVTDWVFLTLLVSTGLIVTAAVVFVVSAILLRAGNSRKRARWEDLEARWEPVMLDVISGEEPPAALLKHVRRGEELYFVDFVHRYASRMSGPERRALGRAVEPYLPAIARRTRGGDPERRARAVQTLSVLALDRHAPSIRAALEDPSPLVSMVAARALVQLGDPADAAAMLDNVHRFSDWRPKYVSSLLAAFGPRALPVIREAAADAGRTPEVRVIAFDALAALNDLEAGDIAADVVESAEDPEIVSAALRVLQRTGRPEHRRVVLPRLTAKEFAVRAQATSALAHIGDSLDDAVRLQGALDDPSPWVAIHAARGLADMGERATLQALAASSHPRAPVARQALTE